MRVLLQAGAMLLLVCGLLAGPALAISLDEAKAQGLVGERVDGFVGTVDAKAPAEVRELVERINAERRARYEELAQQRGVPMDAVARIAGEKLIERTPAGQFVTDAGGRWRQK